MKVLWLGGIILPKIAEIEGLTFNHMNGWLIKLSEELKNEQKIDLVYVFDSENYKLKCSMSMHQAQKKLCADSCKSSSRALALIKPLLISKDKKEDNYARLFCCSCFGSLCKASLC